MNRKERRAAGKRAGNGTAEAAPNALLAEASYDRERRRRRVEIDLGKILRKIETARLPEEAASEARDLNVEKGRLAANQAKAGVISAATRLAHSLPGSSLQIHFGSPGSVVMDPSNLAGADRGSAAVLATAGICPLSRLVGAEQ